MKFGRKRQRQYLLDIVRVTKRSSTLTSISQTSRRRNHKQTLTVFKYCPIKPPLSLNTPTFVDIGRTPCYSCLSQLNDKDNNSFVNIFTLMLYHNHTQKVLTRSKIVSICLEDAFEMHSKFENIKCLLSIYNILKDNCNDLKQKKTKTKTETLFICIYITYSIQF